MMVGTKTSPLGTRMVMARYFPSGDRRGIEYSSSRTKLSIGIRAGSALRADGSIASREANRKA